MGITGVGSSYNFIYNAKTGKLSTKDGSKNEFVDFCNGDVKGSLLALLTINVGIFNLLPIPALEIGRAHV